MAIEKKSLISNRTATKKALVAKPDVSTNPGQTKVAAHRVAAHKVAAHRVAAHKVAAHRVVAQS